MLGALLLVSVVAIGATPRAEAVVPECVLGPSDLIAWWQGEQSLAATIGPDLSGSATFEAGIARTSRMLSAFGEATTL